MKCEQLKLERCGGCFFTWAPCWVEHYERLIQDAKTDGKCIKELIMYEAYQRPNYTIYLAAAIRIIAPEYEKLLILL